MTETLLLEIGPRAYWALFMENTGWRTDRQRMIRLRGFTH